MPTGVAYRTPAGRQKYIYKCVGFYGNPGNSITAEHLTGFLCFRRKTVKSVFSAGPQAARKHVLRQSGFFFFFDVFEFVFSLVVRKKKKLGFAIPNAFLVYYPV